MVLNEEDDHDFYARTHDNWSHMCIAYMHRRGGFIRQTRHDYTRKNELGARMVEVNERGTVKQCMG